MTFSLASKSPLYTFLVLAAGQVPWLRVILIAFGIGATITVTVTLSR